MPYYSGRERTHGRCGSLYFIPSYGVSIYVCSLENSETKKQGGRFVGSLSGKFTGICIRQPLGIRLLVLQVSGSYRECGHKTCRPSRLLTMNSASGFSQNSVQEPFSMSLLNPVCRNKNVSSNPRSKGLFSQPGRIRQTSSRQRIFGAVMSINRALHGYGRLKDMGSVSLLQFLPVISLLKSQFYRAPVMIIPSIFDHNL